MSMGIGIDTYGYDEPAEQEPEPVDDWEYDDDDPRGHGGMRE